jgi:hypothetical protein
MKLKRHPDDTRRAQIEKVRYAWAQRLLKLPSAFWRIAIHSQHSTERTPAMISTRPCTATCVIEGSPVILTFYPDNGVLRIADPSGRCIRQTRWHSSWRALLDEFRHFNEQAEMEVREELGAVVKRLAEPADQPMQSVALA